MSEEKTTALQIRIVELQEEIAAMKQSLLTITRIHPPSVAVREAQIIAEKALGGTNGT